jgi:hypothetical protein
MFAILFWAYDTHHWCKCYKQHKHYHKKKDNQQDSI